jgi:Ras family protein T1
MTTLLDHKTTLEYLAYLGYPGDSTASALQVTKPRKLDRKKGKSSRNVFLTFVCGAAGSGKTSLLRNFAGKPYLDTYHPTKKPISVVNSVDIDGSEKYLVVSFRTKPGLLFITLFQATRVWIVIRSGDLAKLKEDRFT